MRTLCFFVVLSLCSPAVCQASADLVDQIENDPRWVPVEQSLKWCGARTLWLLSDFYKVDCDFDELLAQCRPSSAGDSSLLDISNAARGLGFETRIVQCTADALSSWAVPGITVHRIGDNTLHANLFLGVRDESYVLIDPFQPTQVRRLNNESFGSTWTGHVLLIGRSSAELAAPGERRAYVFRILLVAQGLVLVFLGLGRRFASGARGTLLIFLIGTTLLAVSGCSHETAIATPTLVFEKPHYQKDTSLESEPMTHAFGFRHLGSQSVVLSAVNTSCSCTAPRFPEGAILPGDVGDIALSVNLNGRRGAFRAFADVVVSDADSSKEIERHRLVIETYVTPKFEARPASLSFGDINAGETGREIIRVRAYAQDRSIGDEPGLKLVLENPALTCEIADWHETMLDGRRIVEADIAVTWRPETAGKRLKSQLEIILTASESARPTGIFVPIRGFAMHPKIEIQPRELLLLSGKSASFEVRRRAGGQVPELVLDTVEVPGVSSQLTLSRQDVSNSIAVYALDYSATTGEHSSLSGHIVLQATAVDELKYHLPVSVLK